MIRHQFGQVEFASEHWFRLAATTLASITRSAGLATPAKPRVGAHPPDRPRGHQRADGQPDPRPARGRHQAGARQSRRRRRRWTSRRSTPVAALLNERLSGLTAERAEPGRRATLDDDDRVEGLARRVGERVVRIVRDYDATAIEEVFSDGLLNVMDAPEFAQSDKLRRVFSALENRAYLGQLVGSVADAGTHPGLHRPRERADRDARRVPRPRPVRSRRAGRSAWSACSARPA